MEIIPAIIPQSYHELEAKASRLVGLVKIIQIDICDGVFVPSKSWPYNGSDHMFDEIKKEAQGLPSWNAFDYEVDLMVSRPEKVIDGWITAGASRIIIHIESTNSMDEVLGKLAGTVETGIALSIDTPLEIIDALIGRIQFVQLMGIAKIGFQGQEFDTRVTARVRTLRQKYPALIISVDGGVTLDTAEALLEAGVDRLVAGSAIWKSDNLGETIRQFHSLHT